MVVRKEEMTKEEYGSLDDYMKNRIEPIFTDVDEPLKEEPKVVEEKVLKSEVETKKDEKGLYSYTDLKDMNKKQQIKILKDFGLNESAMKSLKTEKERIDSILSIQENNSKE
ncbi:unnamed protein product [marine sediment metagenome]|uniref:Uncharacterized protein n=1 Tax=marine sediment metagenome TaxID=412755 RepID=X0SC24_9ZZZZ